MVNGVPQSSVMRPLLFLIFINDLQPTVSSKTRLFADHCILDIQIFCKEGAALLQQYIDNFAAWEDKWGMQFHHEKCNSPSVTRSETPKINQYILKGHIMDSATTAKNLGITISNDMN